MTGQRLALLVAADTFADRGLAGLRAPQTDVEALAGVFEDPEIGDFTVERLVNGTSQELRLAVNRLFGQRDPDDFVLVHVSSHGLKDASGELYLATSDTQREHLEATSVEASYLRRQMDRSRAGAAVLLLDCCYGGAFERGMMATRADDAVDVSGAFVTKNEGRGRAVITASTALEYAFEGTELRADQRVPPSVFSAAVVSGLIRGDADLNGDGVVSLGELFTFVSRQVRDRNARQTPQWWLYGMSDELVVARNPNPHIVAADLPPDVTDVLSFPQAAARLGGVLALRELVNGEPGVALTAYQTLETLALDDSRQVSSAATDALATVRVDVAPAVLDFGRVQVGGEAPQLELVLRGSLAGACQLVKHDAPVTITRRGNRARISLDTSAAGEISGRIEVRGPGGGSVELRARIGSETTQRLKSRSSSTSPLLSPSSSIPDVVPVPAGTFASRWGWESLRFIGWGLAGVVVILGLVTIDSGDSDSWAFANTWFGGVQTFLPALAIPLALVGVQFSTSRRGQLASAAAVGGVGLHPAITVIETMTRADEVYLVYVGLLLTFLGVLAFSAALLVRLRRGLPRRDDHLRIVGVLTTVAFLTWAAYLVKVIIEADTHAYAADPAIYGLVAATFLVPVRSTVRVIQGGVVLGIAVSVFLYLSQLLVSEDSSAALDARYGVLFHLAFVVVALVNVAPAWRTLRDADPLGASER